MRKLTVFAVLAALVVVVAPAAMAATTFAWNGEVTSAFMTDFTNATEGQTNMYLNLAVTVTPAITVTGIDFVSATGPTWALTNGNGVADASVNIGTILGLDAKTIGEVVTIGYFAPGATEYAVSGIALEDTLGASAAWAAPSLQIQSVTTINSMINLQLAVDPASLFTTSQLYLANVYGSVGPLSFSVAYGSSKGQHADVKFAQSFGDVGVSANVQEDLDTVSSNLKFGVGAAVTYQTLLTVGVGTYYDLAAGAGLGPIGVNVNLAPAATWGADLGLKMALDGTGFANTGFVDASVWTKLDASTLRVGYDYTMTGGAYEAGKVLTNGGLYFNYDVSF
jgi:hypothetical protein